ncbi:MAG: phosphoenolpyruvate carboxykinase (GTP) [Acidobacteriota bacterium]|nr:phosphoenolpyruvate carboxykinase (GTP) [Acidobacteriota bacterium]HOF82675.1 phosphoenolpyruvate carboxykinase (GTP) [Candidatus Aminicenantes bacterium]MDD8032922.1 phosphoenolpyruvate carboxykinase (GTP) [Acidobacteriota bacterium]MDD8038812.1 phosphoenolpyruvate carboxykinase (GTP) [Acidobacteriota bacterium]HOS10958.1 phosphoenolpyruvate carboxykinase (GTP) [Candidatus Aminicenantes bacterium]
MSTPVERWVEEQERIYKPKRVYWCDGSEAEAHRLIEIGLREEKIGPQPVFTALNQANWPDAYLHHSHPTDVARTEQLTFVCHPEKDQSGPNNNWMAPDKAKAMLTKLADGAMRGRTMYVLPYMMGHPDSPYAKACLQITDISYVAVSMRIMTRMGTHVLKRIGTSERFVKGSHSVGDFSPNRRYIMHFPRESLVWSIGSGYGGNALLGKKCFALRVASYLGLRQGWLAEHMVVMGIEDMKGRVTYITAAMPSACGKTNLAMLQSALPEYRVFTIGDDIAWMNVGPDGRLYAINPEAGFFGVAPGTSMKTNPNMIRTLKGRNFYPTLYTNVGRDVDANEPWWEGLDGLPPRMEDWQGRPWIPGSKDKIAHPNSRFTVSLYNCPTLSPEFDNPRGVPISAILIGGRRSHLMPLVVEAFDWTHGVFMGARTGSETTAAAAGAVGVLRRDPFAMLPFCGYNMGDYFRHWMNTGALMRNPPKIFAVNWFRVDENGKFVWPGFGDNMRVLKWIIDRVDGKVGARETPIGLVPDMNDFNMEGLPIPRSKMDRLFEIKPSEWKGEAGEIKKFFNGFGRTIPFELRTNLEKMERALKL